MRSSTSSAPTESRSRFGGAGEVGPSTEARCSIRLSTPPSEVARFHKETRAAVAMRGLLAASDQDREHAAEAALHLAGGQRVALMGRAGQGRGRARSACGAGGAPPGAWRRHRRRGRAGAGCACRGVSSQASNGPRMAPWSWRMVRMRAQSSSSAAVTRAPAITSLWPFRYLVAECMTRSAPSASGRVRTGVGDRVVDGEPGAGRVCELGQAPRCR